MQAKKKQAFLSSSPNVLPRLKFALWNNKQANFIKVQIVSIPKFATFDVSAPTFWSRWSSRP